MFSTKLSSIVKLVNTSKLLKINTLRKGSALQCQQKRLKSDLYEPDYLISMEPDEPVYDCLNLQLKGYDYALLESAQSQVHRYAEVMGLQVEECWATPAQQLNVQRYKPNGTVVDAEYKLNVYERNVQVNDVPAWALGTLLRVSRAVLPEGCTLNVHEHTREHEEIRYVPDNQLLELKEQLVAAGGPTPDKKKRRHSTLFTPPLPEGKVHAIEVIAFGVVDKVTFRFPYKWMNNSFIGFLWKTEDINKVPEGDEWLTRSEGLTVPMSCENCGTIWFNGDRAKLIETIPEEELKTKVMGIIKKFVGPNVIVPDPVEMIRSTWYTNPFTRGSYSFEGLLTPQNPDARTDLAKPLVDAAGKPRVLFAGEATNPTHFSTVHGALETGLREASRLETLVATI